MADRHQIRPYTLRLPEEARIQLEAAAKERGRTLHAEIVSRLQASLERQDDSAALEELKRMLRVFSAMPTLFAKLVLRMADEMPRSVRARSETAPLAVALAAAVVNDNADVLVDAFLALGRIHEADERARPDGIIELSDAEELAMKLLQPTRRGRDEGKGGK